MFNDITWILATSFVIVCRGSIKAEMSITDFTRVSKSVQYVQCGGNVDKYFYSIHIFYSSSSNLSLVSYLKLTNECKTSQEFASCLVEESNVYVKVIPELPAGETREISCIVRNIESPPSTKFIEKTYSLNFTNDGPSARSKDDILSTKGTTTGASKTSGIEVSVFTTILILLTLAMVAFTVLLYLHFQRRFRRLHGEYERMPLHWNSVESEGLYKDPLSAGATLGHSPTKCLTSPLYAVSCGTSDSVISMRPHYSLPRIRPPSMMSSLKDKFKRLSSTYHMRSGQIRASHMTNSEYDAKSYRNENADHMTSSEYGTGSCVTESEYKYQDDDLSSGSTYRQELLLQPFGFSTLPASSNHAAPDVLYNRLAEQNTRLLSNNRMGSTLEDEKACTAEKRPIYQVPWGPKNNDEYYKRPVVRVGQRVSCTKF